MKRVTLTVNGEEISADVAPRTNLADFLREELFLTGTHVGCEQGVCGACTVMIDGAPARSCIAFAVACNGADVRTIESFDDDPRMDSLRTAFTQEHALQCGYCTPGMLISSYDIIGRLPDADEARLRQELSGNLCRCTGYVGIISAVRSCLGTSAPETSGIKPAFTVERDIYVAPPSVGTPAAALPSDVPVLHRSFTVAHSPGSVWDLFRNIEAVAACMPGVTLTALPVDGQVEGRVVVKLGPISASFAGTATIAFNDKARTGMVAGQGRDSGSGSSVRGEVRFAVNGEGNQTQVDVTLTYALTGSFAQFARGGIVNDVAARITRDFAANLQDRLEGREARVTEIAGGSRFLGAAWDFIKRLFGRS